MSLSSTPRSEPIGRSSTAIPSRWTSVFRSPPSSILPRPGSGEWPPVLLALVLLTALIAQFALPSRTELPEDSGLAPRRLRSPTATMVPDYPAVLHAPIFSPDRAPGESALQLGAPGTVNVQVLGVADGGRVATAVVRGQDGAVHVLEPGQELQGWKLTSVASNAAVFTGPGGRVSVPVGGPPPTPVPNGPHPGQTTASEPQP